MDIGRLEVTEEILERVVYGMENQKNRLLLDPSDGILRPESENDSTFIPLPAWGPSDGYRLMDGFTGTLPDTAFRERLFEILHSGSGVFRRFKDLLKERSELEGLWRRYKKREMRKSALSWLSRWSDALALESLGPEPEDWGDLASVDFAVRLAESRDRDTIRIWDRSAEIEAYPELSFDERQEALLRERGEADIEDGEIFVAENPAGEIVGFSWVLMAGPPDRLEGRLIQVYVLPEFRGLGIGRMLSDTSLEKASSNGAMILNVRTGASGKFMNDYLKRSGFSPAVTWWRKKRADTFPESE